MMMPAAPTYARPSGKPVDVCRKTLARFARDESGALTYFILVLFVLMILMGGMARDLMMYENHRTALRQTTDRCALAAASLRQTQTPSVVIDDCFAKAQMTQYLTGRGSNTTLNGKEVWVEAKDIVPTYFMRMLNVPTLPAIASAKAEEGVGNIEISLVIDISGSMREGGTPSQITQLRAAAKEFFSIVLAGDAKDTTSINVVPYAGQVNVGVSLFNRFIGASARTQFQSDKYGNFKLDAGGAKIPIDSSCIELQGTDYTTMAPPPATRTQVPAFMYWTIDNPTMNWGWCPTNNSAIQIAQNDVGKLNTFIDNIRLHDGTGTHNGVKYGVMLLNPALRGTFAALSGTEVPPQFNDRPLAWSSSTGSDVKKYMIIMTDGAITDQYRPKYAVFRDTDADNLDNEKVDGVDDLDFADPDIAKNFKADGTNYTFWNAGGTTPGSPASGGGTTFGKELENQPASNRTTLTGRSANVASFDAQCKLAKDNGVTVYTIAFNATASAQAEMLRCASGQSFFFNAGANNSALMNTFRQIARQIRQLRLTQ